MTPSPVVERVPVAPLREAFERSGLTVSEVARRLGWYAGLRYHGCPRPDTSRVRRALGLVPHVQARTGARYLARRIGYEHAAQLAAALEVDPVEVGL